MGAMGGLLALGFSILVWFVPSPKGLFPLLDSSMTPVDRVTSSPPSMSKVSLASFNLPEYYIRHRDSLGELTKTSSHLDEQDATFSLVLGLADKKLVSFESSNFPGFYLRHQNGRIYLQHLPSATEPSYQLFLEDATFSRQLGFHDAHAVSFCSYRYPNLFLRHRDFHLWVEPISGEPSRSDATFYLVSPKA